MCRHINITTHPIVSGNVQIGENQTNGGFENILIGKTVSCAAGNGCVIVGKGSTISGDACNIIGRDNSSTDRTVIVGFGNTSSAQSAFIIGNECTNGETNSLLIGNTSFVNIRSASLTTDLGTPTETFQSLYLSGDLVGPITTTPIDNIVSNSGASTNNNIAVFNGTSGKNIQDGGILKTNIFLADGTVPMTGDFDANSHELINVSAIRPPALNTGCIFGLNATSSGNSNVCVGNNATASGLGTTVVGRLASATVNNCLAIGISSQTSGVGGLSLGRSTLCSGADAISIGTNANASSTNSINIGTNSVSSQTNSISIGTAANNSIASSCLIGDVSILNIRPNSNTCDLGTSSVPFQIAYLKDNQTASVSRYCMYTAVTVANTAVETSALTGSSIGSLTYAPTQALGMTINFWTAFTFSCNALVNLGLRLKLNGTQVVFHNPTFAVGATNSIITQSVVGTVISGTQMQLTSTYIQTGNAPAINTQTVAYTRTNSNTWSYTLQWSAAAAANTITMTTFNMQTLFNI